MNTLFLRKLFLYTIIFIFSMIIMVLQCKKSKTKSPDEKEILELVLTDGVNSYIGNISGMNVTFTDKVPFGTTEMRIKTLRVSDNAITDKLVGDKLIMGMSSTIKVTSGSGTANTYIITIEVTPATTDKDIRSLVITDGITDYASTISGTTISFQTVPFGTTVIRVKALVLSENAISDKNIGDVLSITGDFIVVTAQDGSMKSYSVKINVALASSDKDITAIVLTDGSMDYSGMISGSTINFHSMPFGTTEMAIKTLILSNNAVADKNIHDVLSITGDFIVVTAQDESIKTYTVRINVRSASSDKDITAIVLTDGSTDYSGMISGTTISFSALVYGTTEMTIKTLMFSQNATVDKNVNDVLSISGETIVVTAQDKSTNIYTLTMPVASSTMNKNIRFIIITDGVTDYSGTISGTTISFPILPYGTTEVTIKTLIYPGTTTASKSVNDILVVDGTHTITVTARDGSTKIYTLTLMATPATTDKDITSISITDGSMDYSGTISGMTIRFPVLPYGTTEVTLKTLVFSQNATSDKNVNDVLSISGETIVVTAQDNSTKIYTLLISVTPATTDKDILSIVIRDGGEGTPDYNGTISGTIISFSVLPYGTTEVTLKSLLVSQNAIADKNVNDVLSISGESIVVTAQDNSTKTYTLAITVAGLLTPPGIFIEIPDDNFRAKIIDTDEVDDIIDVSGTGIRQEALERISYIAVNNSSITSLQGVQYMTSLTHLPAYNNSLTDIDVSNNTSLTYLRINNNSLRALNVSANTELVYLDATWNSLTDIDVSGSISLTYLIVYDNSLADIDLSTNTLLQLLSVNSNSLTDIDVSGSTSLTYLTIHNNSLTDIDVSGSTSLTYLTIQNNSLTDIDLSTNTALTLLYALRNSLTDIDVSTNTLLQRLDARHNSLTDIDVSTNTSLTFLWLNNNSLTNVSTNTNLLELDIRNNSLTGLDISASVGLYNLTTYNNPDLECIQITKGQNIINIGIPGRWMTQGRHYLLKDCTSPLIFIPDANFRQAVMNTSEVDNSSIPVGAYNTASYKTILQSDLEKVTNLNANSRGITSLSGVGYMTSLTRLNVNTNSINTIDVSANTELAQLHVYGNSLTSVNVGAITSLTYLSVYNNSLTSLNVSATTELNHLYSTGNPDLSCIQITKGQGIENKSLGYGQYLFKDCTTPLIPIPDANFRQDIIDNTSEVDDSDVHNNSILQSALEKVTNLNANSSSITSLVGLSYMTSLSRLNVNTNSLRSVEISSANTALTQLHVYSNSLTSINVEDGNSLTYLSIYNNSLTALNVSATTELDYLYTTGNPNLECIQIADGQTINNVITGSGQYFSKDCSSLIHIPDANFRSAIISEVGNSYVRGTSIRQNALEKITNLNAEYQNIINITGVEYMRSLTYLNMKGNSLNSADVSNNTKLTYLNIESNSLTDLTVATNTSLTQLWVRSNSLRHLDTATNTRLTHLQVRSNSLTHINVSSNTKLERLYVNHNSLTNLDISTNTKLDILYVHYNSLTNLDISNNTKLRILYVFMNSLSMLDISTNTELNTLITYGNPLSCIQNTSGQKIANIPANRYCGY